MEYDLIDLACKLGKRTRENPFHSHPVVRDPEGNLHVCLLFIDSPPGISPRCKWYAFGTISELVVDKGEPDIVLYGYRECEYDHMCIMTNFSLSSLIMLDCKVFIEYNDIINHCPPKGWTLMKEKDDASVLENIQGKTRQLP